MNRSPDRTIRNISNDPKVNELMRSWQQQQLEIEETDEWKIDNLEYDLRTNSTIIDKCKDTIYAQHIYAALCNNEFQKNDVMPILKDIRWSCSWRHAGGIVADIRQEGDYMDWYCSGINRKPDDVTEQDFNNMSLEQQKYHLESKAFVAESDVTDEVRADLFNLGWLVIHEEKDSRI